MRDLPEGWRRLTPDEHRDLGLSPRTERYVTPDGLVVSRRAMENAYAQQFGWRSYLHYLRVAKSKAFRWHLIRKYGGPESELARGFVDEYE